MYLYLTTAGRRTGRPREIEIWFTRHAGAWYVIAEHGERAQWVQNLIADPCVAVRIGRRRFLGVARIVNAARETRLACSVQRRSERTYGWGDGLIVEIRATAAREASGARTSSRP
jgi:deazaflavin-dependent oxidoreductase (nitroreductase family)